MQVKGKWQQTDIRNFCSVFRCIWLDVCDYVNVHVCECDNPDHWKKPYERGSHQIAARSTLSLHKYLQKQQHTFGKGCWMSGLFVCLSLLHLFIYFYSNPHNPQAVICSCSVIWWKASPLSAALSVVHPFILLSHSNFPCNLLKSVCWLVVLLFLLTLCDWHHRPVCVCVSVHVQVPPWSIMD